jgi:hypothetical protein
VKSLTTELETHFAGADKTSNTFTEVCSQLGVPIADDKAEGPSTSITYLGLCFLALSHAKYKRLLNAGWLVKLSHKMLMNHIMTEVVDSAGGVSKGCGIYFDGKWACLNWPSELEQRNILKDITYLELIPIALSVYLWGNQWHELETHESSKI